MLKWYIERYSILIDCFDDVRVLLALRDYSDPAETLTRIKERLAKARQSLDSLDQTQKELDNESKEEKETE